MRSRMFVVIISLLALAVLAACEDPGPQPPPVLKVEPIGTIDFGTEYDELFLTVDNSGGQTLEWTITADGGDGWLHVDPTRGVNQGIVNLTVDRFGLEPGSTHTATLKVTSNGGNVTRTVTMSVPEGEPEPPLPRVEDVSVTGFTVPSGWLQRQTHRMGTAHFGASFGTDPSPAVALHRLSRELDGAWAGPSRNPGSHRIRADVSIGYEAGFVVSWESVFDADGYAIYVEEGGEWTSVVRLDAADVEYDDDGYAIYIVKDGFAVGDEKTYAVKALSDSAPEGSLSEGDTGVIIAPAYLLGPAAGSTVSPTPLFAWEPHPEGTAYGVYLSQGHLADHVWHVVVDGDVTEVGYPGDDPFAEPSLPAGEYLWYIVARGPIVNGKTGGMAISKDWAFSVED